MVTTYLGGQGNTSWSIPATGQSSSNTGSSSSGSSSNSSSSGGGGSSPAPSTPAKQYVQTPGVVYDAAGNPKGGAQPGSQGTYSGQLQSTGTGSYVNTATGETWSNVGSSGYYKTGSVDLARLQPVSKDVANTGATVGSAQASVVTSGGLQVSYCTTPGINPFGVPNNVLINQSNLNKPTSQTPYQNYSLGTVLNIGTPNYNREAQPLSVATPKVAKEYAAIGAQRQEIGNTLFGAEANPIALATGIAMYNQGLKLNPPAASTTPTVITKPISEFGSNRGYVLGEQNQIAGVAYERFLEGNVLNNKQTPGTLQTPTTNFFASRLGENVSYYTTPGINPLQINSPTPLIQNPNINNINSFLTAPTLVSGIQPLPQKSTWDKIGNAYSDVTTGYMFGTYFTTKPSGKISATEIKDTAKSSFNPVGLFVGTALINPLAYPSYKSIELAGKIRTSAEQNPSDNIPVYYKMKDSFTTTTGKGLYIAGANVQGLSQGIVEGYVLGQTILPYLSRPIQYISQGRISTGIFEGATTTGLGAISSATEKFIGSKAIPLAFAGGALYNVGSETYKGYQYRGASGALEMGGLSASKTYGFVIGATEGKASVLQFGATARTPEGNLVQGSAYLTNPLSSKPNALVLGTYTAGETFGTSKVAAGFPSEWSVNTPTGDIRGFQYDSSLNAAFFEHFKPTLPYAEVRAFEAGQNILSAMAKDPATAKKINQEITPWNLGTNKALNAMNPAQKEFAINFVEQYGESSYGFRGLGNAFLGRGVERFSGSVTIEADKGFEFNANRVGANGKVQTGDFDIQMWGEAKPVAAKLAKELQARGSGIKYTPDTGLIQVKSGSGYINAFDIHGTDLPQLNMGEFPMGYKSQSPKIQSVNNVNVPANTLFESATQKAAGAFEVRSIDTTNQKTLAPREGQEKSLTDFPSIARAWAAASGNAQTKATITSNVNEYIKIQSSRFPGMDFNAAGTNIVLNPPSTSPPSVVVPFSIASAAITPATGSMSIVRPESLKIPSMSKGIQSVSINSPSIGSPSKLPSLKIASVGSPSIKIPSPSPPQSYNILTSPSIGSPSIGSPSIGSPSIGSPSIVSPSIGSPSLIPGLGLPPPGLGFPVMPFGLDEGKGGKVKHGVKRRTGYFPSYGALVFNIYGKKPTGTETGLRVRPILSSGIRKGKSKGNNSKLKNTLKGLGGRLRI